MTTTIISDICMIYHIIQVPNAHSIHIYNNMYTRRAYTSLIPHDSGDGILYAISINLHGYEDIIGYLQIILCPVLTTIQAQITFCGTVKFIDIYRYRRIKAGSTVSTVPIDHRQSIFFLYISTKSRVQLVQMNKCIGTLVQYTYIQYYIAYTINKCVNMNIIKYVYVYIAKQPIAILYRY